MGVVWMTRLLAGLTVIMLGAFSSAVPAPAGPAVVSSGAVVATGRGPATVAATLRPGDTGASVRSLQTRLNALGYWCGSVDGRYGTLTKHAVLAVQKAAGLARDGVAGPRTMATLAAGVRPHARSTSGLVVEVNLARQLLLVVRDGHVLKILHTSTGSGRYYAAADGSRVRAITPRGHFRVLRQIDGWRHARLGWLWRPKYYTAYGLAVHGFSSIPAYPASHGCVRLSNQAMDLMWSRGYLPLGGRIYIY